MVSGNWEIVDTSDETWEGSRAPCLEGADSSSKLSRPYARRRPRWFYSTVLLALLLVLCLVLLLALHATPRTCPTCSPTGQVSRSEYLDAPLTPFSELTVEEVNAVLAYFQRHAVFNLTDVNQAGIGDNFIHYMEAVVPPKVQVLRYLEHGGSLPPRTARVLLFRGKATPPVVEEYELALTEPYEARLATNKSRKTTIPYTLRPFSRVEFRAIYRRLQPLVSKELGQLIRESYGASLPPGCRSRCLRLQMTPVSSVFLPPDTRAAWFWLAYDREFFVLHPLDLQFLVNTTDTNPDRWNVMKVYYAQQLFGSLEELSRAYQAKTINVTRTPFPEGPESELYSSLYLRGDPFPKTDQPPPLSFLSKGNRFTVRGNRVEYMQWYFTIRVSPSVGLQLFDINFGKERIAYEISLQEIAVLYAGFSPVSSTMYFTDSAGLFGTRMRGMMEGVDCPWHATYLDTRLFASNDGGLRRFARALCLFEHDHQLPLRRHRAYSMTGAFYGALTDTVLVVRSFISFINYDYVLDFSFHQNGAIEVSISSTGYLTTSFYVPPEERFGTRVSDFVSAGLHQHLFHLKADLDVGGTRNRFEYFNIGVENATGFHADKSPPHQQFHMYREVRQRESQACYNFNFLRPKYLLLSGTNVSDLGHRRSYRLIPRGMTPALLPPGVGFESSVSWARCQVAVTKQKDSEATSSSVFAMWDARDPVINFTSYLADDEDINDQDLVAWVTLGSFHIPHLENTPNTATVGNKVSLFLTPFNFFPRDPSMASRDAVRVSPRDADRPLEGAIVERYNMSSAMTCIPDVSLASQGSLNDAGLFS